MQTLRRGVPIASAWSTGAPPAATDVATIDGLIAALYACISGPAGAPRDWVRYHTLFAPGALLTQIGEGDDGQGSVERLTTEEYQHDRSALFAHFAFYEHELARHEESFGSIAHVWSAYEGRATPSGDAMLRGANSLQLVNDGARWWIISILWQRETERQPLPDRLLAPARR